MESRRLQIFDAIEEYLADNNFVELGDLYWDTEIYDLCMNEEDIQGLASFINMEFCVYVENMLVNDDFFNIEELVNYIVDNE